MDKPTRIFLLVEDDPGDVFLMRRALHKAEFPSVLKVVTTGQLAIDYLYGEGEFRDRAQHPRPALIFLDLKLPYKNGFEILKWIRSQGAFDRIVVVVLTSSNEERDMHQAYQHGARSFLVKPPTPQMIQDLMLSLESYW